MHAYDDPLLPERLKRELGINFEAAYIELKEPQRESLLTCAYETEFPFAPGALGSRAMALYEHLQRAERAATTTASAAADSRPARRPRP